MNTKTGDSSPDNLKQIAEDILIQTKHSGASDAEVSISSGQGYSTTVRLGKVESINQQQAKSLDVTVYFGKKMGTASTADFSKKSLHLTIAKACHIANFTNQDRYAGLADPSLMAHNYPDLDLYHPWQITIPQAIELAKKYEEAGLTYAKQITNSEGTTINSKESYNVYANTNNFLGHYPTTLHSVSTSLIAQNKSQMQRDGDYTVSRVPKLLTATKPLGQNAAKLTLRRLGARHIKTQECPVIFEAAIAKSLIGHLLSAASGSHLYNKTSFLSQCLGKQVLAPHLSLDEQPLLPKALGSAAFDNEGVATTAQKIAENGKLVRYLLDSYAGRKLKMQTTGNAGGYYNIFLTTKNKEIDLTTLLQEMNKGLLVIELLGQGINLTTGDYSRGAFGFWVENGHIQYPVEGFTIAGNLKDMLGNIVAMSNDIDKRDTIFTGSLLIPKMHIGGK